MQKVPGLIYLGTSNIEKVKKGCTAVVVEQCHHLSRHSGKWLKTGSFTHVRRMGMLNVGPGSRKCYACLVMSSWATFVEEKASYRQVFTHDHKPIKCPMWTVASMSNGFCNVSKKERFPHRDVIFDVIGMYVCMYIWSSLVGTRCPLNDNHYVIVDYSHTVMSQNWCKVSWWGHILNHLQFGQEFAWRGEQMCIHKGKKQWTCVIFTLAIVFACTQYYGLTNATLRRLRSWIGISKLLYSLSPPSWQLEDEHTCSCNQSSVESSIESHFFNQGPMFSQHIIRQQENKLA